MKPDKLDWKAYSVGLEQQLAEAKAELASERARRFEGNRISSEENADLHRQIKLLRDLIPKRIPDGFVSFGKCYAEQEDKFNDPFAGTMTKFKSNYLSDCERALAATATEE